MGKILHENMTVIVIIAPLEKATSIIHPLTKGTSIIPSFGKGDFHYTPLWQRGPLLYPPLTKGGEGGF